MFKRAINYTQWISKEILGGDIEHIYNELSKSEKYEVTIDYQKRVKSFGFAINSLENNYDNVLDLACGTGALIEALLLKNQNVNIQGIDISGGMLEKAKMRFKGKKNIQLEMRDFMDIQSLTKQFDLITMSYATRFISPNSITEFSHNVKKCLKPNGRFLVFVQSNMFWEYVVSFSSLLGTKGVFSKLHWEKYFVQAMSHDFDLVQNVFVGRSVCIKNKGLIFKVKK